MKEKIAIVSEALTEDSLNVLFEVDNIQKKIPAELYLEEPENSEKAYKKLLRKSKKVLETLFYKDELSRIIDEVAVEITESAYEGELRAEEYINLKQDLSISSIQFFEEELIIVFLSPKIFLKNTINVQTDYSLEIEDLNIDM